MNHKITKSFNHKQDLINRHLKYLYEQKASTMLKIQAIELLYPYINEDYILQKLEFFYERERDLYVKNLLKKAITGKLETFIQTKFEEEQTQELSNQDLQPKHHPSLSIKDIALLKNTNF